MSGDSRASTAYFNFNLSITCLEFLNNIGLLEVQLSSIAPMTKALLSNVFIVKIIYIILFLT